MSAPRIGITQRVEVIESYGEQRDCLDQAWTNLLRGLDMLPLPLPNQPDTAIELAVSIELDGIILSGGNDIGGVPGARNVSTDRDQTERQLLDLCFSRGIPVLGVCRGFQMINTWLGGKLSPVSDHVAKRHMVHTTGSAPASWPGSFEVNSFHDFGITEEGLAPLLQPIAVCRDGSIEAARHEAQPCFAMMWHPEREKSFDGRDLELIRDVFGKRGET